MDKEAARILLVEDEPTIRFVAERQFKVLGYELADIATDGVEAVKKALSSDFDLIFMDIRMPELDGLSATRQLREAGNNSVIVGMTAFSHRQNCIAAGMDDFVQKPVMLEQLKAILCKWLIEKPSRSEIAPVIDIPGPEKFEHTREQLAELQNKIHELRRRSGM